MVTLLNVWKSFKASNKSGGWCQQHFLINRHLQFALEVRRQLVELCHNCGVRLDSTRDMDTVRKALARGLFINVAQRTTEGHYVTLDSGEKCHIHPQSVLFNKKPEVRSRRLKTNGGYNISLVRLLSSLSWSTPARPT